MTIFAQVDTDVPEILSMLFGTEHRWWLSLEYGPSCLSLDVQVFKIAFPELAL